jgi:hypothetical protein
VTFIYYNEATGKSHEFSPTDPHERSPRAITIPTTTNFPIFPSSRLAIRFTEMLMVTACFCWLLAWLILRPWKWKSHVPPKHRLTFTRLYGPVKLKSIFFFSCYRKKNENLLCCIILHRKIISRSFGIAALFHLRRQRKYFNMKVTTSVSKKGHTRASNSLSDTVSACERFHSSYLWTRRCNSAAAAKCSQFLVPEWQSQEVGTQEYADLQAGLPLMQHLQAW